MEFQRKSVHKEYSHFQSEKGHMLNVNLSVDSSIPSQNSPDSDIAKSTSRMSKCFSCYYRLSSLLFLAALIASIYFTNQS